MPERTFWFIEKIKDSYHGDSEVRTQVTEDKATLVSSLLTNGKHYPTLDIDMPAKLVPSSTPGHFHLYIDCEMSWWRYRRLLKALMKAGVIERGYYKANKSRKATFVRKPGVMKEKRTG